MERRTFLKRGLLGGVVLLLGGSAGLALRPTRWVAAPTRALRVVDSTSFQVLVAIAARMVPGEDADPVAIVHDVDDALTRAPPEGQSDMNRLLKLFENALPGLLLDGRTAPFTHLSPAAQDRVLARWRDSRLVLRRGAYQALRKLCIASYYASPATWKAIHYPGPPDTAGFRFEDSKTGTPAWLAAQVAERDKREASE